jgi:hypothetical protein
MFEFKSAPFLFPFSTELGPALFETPAEDCEALAGKREIGP